MLEALREENARLKDQLARLESQVPSPTKAVDVQPAASLIADAGEAPLLPASLLDDPLLDFRQLFRLLCALTVPFLLLLLLESSTARYTLGGREFAASMHLLPHQPAAAPAAAAGGSAGRLPLRPDTVGGLLVLYRNPRAALRVMRQYREAYPEGDLVIGCDDGCYNFSAAAAHFGAVWDGQARRLTTKTDPGWYVRPPNAMAFVRALGEWLPRIRSPRYMVLETDVFLERRVASPLNFTLNGCVCPPTGWFIGGESVYAEKLNPSYHPSHWRGSKVPYGGQGGSILSTRFMAAIAQQPSQHLANDLALFFGCSTTVGIDYFISALVHRYNGSVGEYAGYLNWPGEASLWRHGAGNIEALHPDKTEYGQALSPEDLAILGPHWDTPLQVPPSTPVDAPRVHSQCTWEQGVAYRWGDSGLREDALARGEAWPPEGFGRPPSTAVVVEEGGGRAAAAAAAEEGAAERRDARRLLAAAEVIRCSGRAELGRGQQ